MISVPQWLILSVVLVGTSSYLKVWTHCMAAGPLAIKVKCGQVSRHCETYSVFAGEIIGGIVGRYVG